MFYSSELLSKRDSGFGLLWLAATLGSKSTLKKLTKKSVLKADISLLCEQIGQPSEPLALRLSSNLMVGVARVYKLKHEIFVTDVTTVYSTLKKAGDLGASSAPVVDPKSLQMKKSTAAVDRITMAVDNENFLDFDFDAFAFNWDVQMNDTDSVADASLRSKSLEANRTRHTIDESHLQSSSLDNAYDPYDYFDVGNGAGESSAHIDLELDLDLGWDAGPQLAPDGDAFMEDADLGVQPDFDVADYLPDELVDFALGPEAPASENGIAGSETRRSRSPATIKRGRSEDQEDELVVARATPRSILRATPLSEVGNMLQERGFVQDNDFVTAEPDQIAIGGDENVTIDEEGRAETPKPKKVKKAKKQVRVLLDARTELTDKELKDARDNYLTEQTRLRLAIDEQRYNKEAAERVQGLLRAPPAMFQAEPLQELWAATFLAQIETKTGIITLVNAEPRKRVKKRRRIDVDAEGGDTEQEKADDFRAKENDVDFGGDQDMFFGGDEYAMNDDMGPFDINQSRIRSSEEPEQARNAPSRAQSVNSVEMYRGQDVDVRSQNSGLFPWDGAAPSSSLNQGFIGSVGSRGSGRRSLDVDIVDTNLALRSLSGSRRGSVSHRGAGSPVIPASLADAPLDDFEFSIGEDQGDVNIVTQMSETTPEALERNAQNFLAFAKMQRHSQNRPLTLDDFVTTLTTPHVAANAFYCCLVLATKNLLRLTQTEPFGTITVDLIG